MRSSTSPRRRRYLVVIALALLVLMGTIVGSAVATRSGYYVSVLAWAPALVAVAALFYAFVRLSVDPPAQRPQQRLSRQPMSQERHLHVRH